MHKQLSLQLQGLYELYMAVIFSAKDVYRAAKASVVAFQSQALGICTHACSAAAWNHFQSRDVVSATTAHTAATEEIVSPSHMSTQSTHATRIMAEVRKMQDARYNKNRIIRCEK